MSDKQNGLQKKWVWKDPAIETGLGITTNSFAPPLQQGELSLEDLFQYAAQNGFSWVELRDQDGSMTIDQCRKAKRFAQDQGLSVHYAWNNVDIHLENLEDFQSRMVCAAVFGQNTHCRIAISPGLLLGKYGYTEKDLEILIPKLQALMEIAQRNGVKLCFENSMEPICGTCDAWGMEKLYDLLPALSSTLDAANMTYQVKDTQITTEDLIGYYQRNKTHLPYFHLKTSRQRKWASPYLEDGDFQLSRLLKAFDPGMLVCLELPPQKKLAEIQYNVEKSLAFLQMCGHIERGEEQL